MTGEVRIAMVVRRKRRRGSARVPAAMRFASTGARHERAGPAVPTSPAEYKLADVVSLYSQQTAVQIQLWAFYTTTVLGSIVFSLAGPRTTAMALIFLPPYWLFGAGELFLMYQTLSLLKIVRASIPTPATHPADPGVRRFGILLAHMARPRNPFLVTALVQVAGHVCVSLLFVGNALRWLS